MGFRLRCVPTKAMLIMLTGGVIYGSPLVANSTIAGVWVIGLKILSLLGIVEGTSLSVDLDGAVLKTEKHQFHEPCGIDSQAGSVVAILVSIFGILTVFQCDWMMVLFTAIGVISWNCCAAVTGGGSLGTVNFEDHILPLVRRLISRHTLFKRGVLSQGP